MARLGRGHPASGYGTVRPFPIITSVPQVLWYALFDVTTGELLSLGTEVPNISPGVTDYVVIGDWDYYSNIIVWDTTLRLFVPKIPVVMIDRVTDVVNDPALASAWAALSTDQSIAMQTRLALLLGSWRWRFDFQDIDLD